MIIVQGGKRWQLVFADPGRGCAGSCDPPTRVGKQIRLRPSLRHHPTELVETIIHECLHAQGWQLDEAFVAQAAADITRVLERLALIRQETPIEIHR